MDFGENKGALNGKTKWGMSVMIYMENISTSFKQKIGCVILQYAMNNKNDCMKWMNECVRVCNKNKEITTKTEFQMKTWKHEQQNKNT